jgi:hypothetical protein
MKKPPLLVSLPRSGLNWLRYCIEYFSKEPTPGEFRLIKKTDENKYIVAREHWLRKGTTNINEHSKAVLILRNYKESFVRHACNQIKMMNDYLFNIGIFDAYKGPKLVTYYEDLITDTNAIGEVLSFLDIEWDFSNVDIEKLKQDSLASYNTGNNKSLSDAKDIFFHSKKLSYDVKIALDKHFMKTLGKLYDKYVARYKEMPYGRRYRPTTLL